MRQPLKIETADLEKVAAKQVETQAPAQKPSSGLANSPSAPTSKMLSVASAKDEKWTVPSLKANFDLDKAKEMAFKVAGAYMNQVLNYDDLNVELDWEGEAPVGHVTDVNTGKLVNSYEGEDMLKLYSQNKKERGIIVDGRV